jgi:hypothetical protein
MVIVTLGGTTALCCRDNYLQHRINKNTSGTPYIFIRVQIAAKSSYYLRPVCLSLRMYQCGFHWTHFREI